GPWLWPAPDRRALGGAGGWNGDRCHRTVRLGDSDGDGDADLCARSSAGGSCWRWSGAGFDAEPVPGPAWSDASGWGAEQHYGTLQLGGAACGNRIETCDGADDGSEGGMDEGSPRGRG